MWLIWWASFWVLCILRGCILLRFLISGSPSLLCLFVVEALALYFGMQNARVAKNRAMTWAGVFPPLAYLLGSLLLPKTTTHTGALLALAGVVLSTWALFHLRQRFSVGPTAWVSLCDTGPYRWVRHPQLLGRLLIVVGVGLGASSIGALLGCAACVLLTACVVSAEEHELRQQPVYAEYVERVPFKLLPGVV